MDHVITALKTFGLDEKSAKLYLLLLQNGTQGVMFLTHESGFGRNVVYRLLSELEDKQLVSVTQKNFGKEYTARSIEALEAMVADKEADIARLKTSLDEVAAGLQVLSGAQSSKITQYRGVDGLKQVLWSLTKADGEFRVYEQSHVHEYIDQAFTDRFRRSVAEKSLQSMDLTNRRRIECFMPDFVDHWQDNCTYRYLDKAVLDIQFEMVIYNDITALLDYSADKPRAIEIQNKKLATMQKQIFDAVWLSGQSMTLDSELAYTIAQ